MRIVEAVDPVEDGVSEHADFGPIVQEEVRRLPEKYRAVVVLCYWQNLTHDQAAKQLGCPIGTVRSRIARARKLLHRRLSRRGLGQEDAVLAGFEGAIAPASPTAVRLAPVSPELVHSTVRAASQVSAGGATAQVVSSLAASLVKRTLWSMTMIKIKIATAALALVGLTGSSAWLAAGHGPVEGAQVNGGQKSVPPDGKTRPRGSRKIYSMVQDQTTILEVVADGSTVKKGDVICVLDSAALRDSLVNQQITTRSASANYENAKLAREEAEIAVVEYTDGAYRFVVMELVGEIKIAETELAVAKAEHGVVQAGKVSDELAIKRAELAVLRAGFNLEKAQNRRKLLVDYAYPKKVKELRGAVEKARSQELVKKATLQLESDKEKKLECQIQICTILAPSDGTLKHYVDTGFMPAPSIEEREIVRERQPLFEIIPIPAAKTGNR